MAFECSGKAFIKLYKKFLEWEWYSDTNTCRLFIHCLLRANWKPTKWHGIELESGQFVTSLPNLAEETGLSVQQVRTAISKLKSTGELTDYQQGKSRVITVNNWNRYQKDNREVNREVTDYQQDDNRIITADKERKNIRSKEENNIYINNNNKYPSSFNEFWDNYPRKQDKGQAHKCYQARLNDGYTEEQLLTACINYAAECEHDKREKKYIKVASTFLSVNEPFVEYLDKEKSDERPKGRVESDISAERESEIREIIRRIESGEADHDDDGLWDGLP